MDAADVDRRPSRTQAYDDLRAAEVAPRGRATRRRSRPPRPTSPSSARRPPPTWHRAGPARAGPRGPRLAVPRAGRREPRRQTPPSRPAAATAPSSQDLKAELTPSSSAGAPLQQRPRQAARGRHQGRLHRATPAASCCAPVTGPVTSPFGYRIHPIYGYWGLHDGTDFGVACGEALRAAGSGTVHLAVLLLGLRQPALPQPRPGQRQDPHRGLQPPLGLPVGVGDDVEPRRHRRATSATPAGRPAATCTSPSWWTARPSTR